MTYIREYPQAAWSCPSCNSGYHCDPGICPDCNHDAKKIGDMIGITLARSVTPGYEPLAAVLQEALDQAQAGKGKVRHANGRAFDRQPIMEIGRMVGLGYPTGQAQKKTQEAVGMFNRGDQTAAVAELAGAINYLAAAIMLIREA